MALKKTLEKQVAVTTDFKDRDVVAVAREVAALRGQPLEHVAEVTSANARRLFTGAAPR